MSLTFSDILPVDDLSEEERNHINQVMQRHLEMIKIDQHRIQKYPHKTSTALSTPKMDSSKQSLYDNLMYSADPESRASQISFSFENYNKPKSILSMTCYICSDVVMRVPFHNYSCSECKEEVCKVHSRPVKQANVCTNCFQNMKYEATSGNWFKEMSQNSNIIDLKSQTSLIKDIEKPILRRRNNDSTSEEDTNSLFNDMDSMSSVLSYKKKSPNQPALIRSNRTSGDLSDDLREKTPVQLNTYLNEHMPLPSSDEEETNDAKSTIRMATENYSRGCSKSSWKTEREVLPEVPAKPVEKIQEEAQKSVIEEEMIQPYLVERLAKPATNTSSMNKAIPREVIKFENILKSSTPDMASDQLSKSSSGAKEKVSREAELIQILKPKKIAYVPEKIYSIEELEGGNDESFHEGLAALDHVINMMDEHETDSKRKESESVPDTAKRNSPKDEPVADIAKQISLKDEPEIDMSKTNAHKFVKKKSTESKEPPEQFSGRSSKRGIYEIISQGINTPGSEDAPVEDNAALSRAALFKYITQKSREISIERIKNSVARKDTPIRYEQGNSSVGEQSVKDSIFSASSIADLSKRGSIFDTMKIPNFQLPNKEETSANEKSQEQNIPTISIDEPPKQESIDNKKGLKIKSNLKSLKNSMTLNDASKIKSKFVHIKTNSSIFSKCGSLLNDFKPDWFNELPSETNQRDKFVVHYRMNMEKGNILLKVRKVETESISAEIKKLGIYGEIVDLKTTHGQTKSQKIRPDQEYAEKDLRVLEFKNITDETILNGYIHLILKDKTKIAKSFVLGETYIDLREIGIRKNLSYPSDNSFAISEFMPEYVLTPRLSYISKKNLGEIFIQLMFEADFTNKSLTKLNTPGVLTVSLIEGFDLTSKESGSRPRVQIEIKLYPLYKLFHNSIYPETQDSSYVKWASGIKFNDLSLNELAKSSLEVCLWNMKGVKDLVGINRFNLGTGTYRGENVNWMDSNSIEKRLWENLLNKPNMAHCAIIPLRAC